MTRIFQGISYNLKGLRLGLSSPKLLTLGLIRLAVIVLITIASAAVILVNYQEILNLMWNRPENLWIVWLWHLTSWFIAMLLVGISAVLGFLASQVLFSVVIMDVMSQITERKITGNVKSSAVRPWLTYFLFLLRQEIPRAVAPILISMILLVLSWFTPLGPVLTVLSPLAAAVFLAWDNSDLVPARRLVPFNSRFHFLRSHLAFHLGFGSLFLIPVANILFLSFAPVGATLFYIEQIDPGSIENTSTGTPSTPSGAA
ncbi:MAG: EI24 domain-containing protein [Desulfobacteraceae bacterium]|nr:EI24 domain-containing protein [Desulfobacteraceae bacterium]